MERSYIYTTARVYVRLCVLTTKKTLIVIRKENCRFCLMASYSSFDREIISLFVRWLTAYLCSTRLYYSSFPQTIPVTPTSGDYLTLRWSLELTCYCRHVQNYRMLSYKRELFSSDILTPRFYDIKTGQGQWTQIVHEYFMIESINLTKIYTWIFSFYQMHYTCCRTHALSQECRYRMPL